MSNANDFEESSFLKVLLTLKENIMNSTNVCDLAIVKSIDGDFCMCSLLNDPDSNIRCIKATNLQANDLVFILYSNSDLRDVWKKYKANQNIQQYISVEKHSCNYGIAFKTEAQSSVTHLYRHEISLYFSPTTLGSSTYDFVEDVKIALYSTSSSTFTKDALESYIGNKTYPTINPIREITGSNSVLIPTAGVTAASDLCIRIYGSDGYYKGLIDIDGISGEKIKQIF